MDGAPLKLSMADLEFEAADNDTGLVYLTVDGIERAFVFRTTFAPVGEATTPREELRPAMRLNAGQFYRTNTKFQVAVEVDNAPAESLLQVSLGQRREGAYEADISLPPLTPRQKRIGFAVRPGDGGIEFDTLLRDWLVPFAAVPVRGERVVQARLLDSAGMDLAGAGISSRHLRRSFSRTSPIPQSSQAGQAGPGLSPEGDRRRHGERHSRRRLLIWHIRPRTANFQPTRRGSKPSRCQVKRTFGQRLSTGRNAKARLTSPCNSPTSLV